MEVEGHMAPCATYSSSSAVINLPMTAAGPGLLDLPSPLIQAIISLSGSGAGSAASSCCALRAAFNDALTCPELGARYLFERHGPNTALFHVYGSPQLRRHLLRGRLSSLQRDDATAKLVRELLRLGASPQVQARFLLTAAAGAGDTRVLRTLLRAGLGASVFGGRALVAAAAAGHVGAMETLLRAGVSPRAEHGMPLRVAAREGQLDAARLLLRCGADPRVAAGAALAEASRGGHLALVLELLAAGVDPRVDGSRALVEAATGGHSCVVLALLAAGAQPAARHLQALRDAVGKVLQATASLGGGGGTGSSGVAAPVTTALTTCDGACTPA